MKPNEDEEIQSLVQAWKVETTDLTARVNAAAASSNPMAELVSVIQALREEVSELHRTSDALRDEVFRLRLELHTPSKPAPTRIAPYAPPESLARLS